MRTICPSDHAHRATRTCYTKHECRCVPCRHANREYQRRERRLLGADFRVPAIGTRRRLRALAVMGWSAHAVAARTGLHEVFVARVRRGAKDQVADSTARAVARVFAELAMTRNPSRDGRVTAAWAARRAWDGPLAWNNIDDPRERAKGAAT